jgi:serine-type D-Ala-D-Ala carboxypeptidase (penicillin-binding protein 5/6)
MQLKSMLFFSIFSVLVSFSAQAELAPLPQPTLVIPTPPVVAAKSYLLIDPQSHYIIAEQAIDERAEPASLTKMMTAYVVDQALKNKKIQLSDQVLISNKAWKTEGSRMFVEVNTLVSVEDLLKGIIIQSGNDASVAIAEHLAGSESAFAEMMNFYAKQLGMRNTHFVNATGLPDPDQYTTARDMATLGEAIIYDFPESYALYSQKEFLYNKIKQENRNRLLWRDDKIDGIKTGHTDAAGFCLVASGQKDNMRLISVVMGTKNDAARIDESQKLLNYGFRFFESRKLYPANTALKKARIWMGDAKEVNIGLPKDLYVTFGQGQYDNLKVSIQIDPLIKAPTPQGAPLGTIAIQLDNKTLAEYPIVALNTIEKGGFLSRLYDRVALSIHSIVTKVVPQ